MTIEKVNESFANFINEAKQINMKTIKDLKLDLETYFDNGKEDSKFADLRKSNTKDIQNLEKFVLHTVKFLEEHPELKDVNTIDVFGGKDEELSKEFDTWINKSSFDLNKFQKNTDYPIADIDMWDYIETIMKAIKK